MAQWVKDPALSLLWLGLLLWRGFDPWPGNFCMARGGQKQKTNRKQGREMIWRKGTMAASDSGAPANFKWETPVGNGLCQEFVQQNRLTMPMTLPFQKTPPCPGSASSTAEALARRGSWMCPPSSSCRILTAMVFL